MSEEKLYIKNMVCTCCIIVVKSELSKLGIEPIAVKLGEVYLKEKLDESKKEQLNEVLQPLGLSLIDDRNGKLIDDIKNRIVELIHCNNNELKSNLSVFIGDNIQLGYNYVSCLFSEIEGKTIEKYFIEQKVEMVKEILTCGSVTLSEIAFKLNYSSLAYLSNQFKKVTGLTPSEFKQLKRNTRISLDKL